MTHNKYLTFLFFEDNDPISAKSAAQILFLNLAKTFLLLNFLITGLHNPSASCSFTLIPDLVFLSKKTYRPYLQFHKLYLLKSYLK